MQFSYFYTNRYRHSPCHTQYCGCCQTSLQQHQGLHFNIKTVFPGMWVPIMIIRRYHDFLSLEWEPSYWHNGVFILKQGPVIINMA